MLRNGWVPVVLLTAGVGLVADAVVRGGASVALVAIVPVVSGSSAEFLVGVVLLLVGFLTLPLAFVPLFEDEPTPSGGATTAHEAPNEEVGGLLLVGPVPVYFGAWKDVSRRTKALTALLGAVLLALLVWALLVH